MAAAARKLLFLQNRFAVKTRKFFNTMFSDKYLLYTNVGLSLSLSGLGDLIEQKYEIYSKEITEWDKKRTLDMTLSGTTVGVVCHYWYMFLDRTIPGYTVRIVFKKIIVDQLIGSPLAISTFFGSIALLEGSTMQEFITEVKQKAWRLYAAEWMIWPPCQFLNFYVLSTKYRVLFDNLVSLGYDVYTSRVKHHNYSSSEECVEETYYAEVD
ncbi:mpv17-like protein 2 [Anthonomus grandis grandis]|uniref:mpv17-like protein 2 n=1 Tax=Anthonomus grandis grandis TaxID=2921223 RepID=UPI002166511B|nr:mpv17-like protein 2 [Anthonomus grandis grandis]